MLWGYRNPLRVSAVRAMLTRRYITEFLGSQALGRAPQQGRWCRGGGNGGRRS